MLVLASQSPTRQALLSGAGLKFESSPAPIDERALEREMAGKTPGAIAGGLAIAKAQAVAAARPDDWVIGADQVLALGERLFHKAADIAEARAQLLELRGREHQLHTAVALARGARPVWSTVETARLRMRNFTAAELDAVLDAEGGAALGSVGGYRLEGPSIQLFERIEGDYFSILGLPLLPLLAALRRLAPTERFT